MGPEPESCRGKPLLAAVMNLGCSAPQAHQTCRRATLHKAAAASVNNQVGAGGACAIVLMFSSAALIGGRPAAQFSIADIAEATRSMFMPVGLPRSKET